jgi:DNA-binding NarL/FixJ family response regulator
MRIDNTTSSREGPSGSRMRVVVADDNVLLRAGLASLLERSGSAVAGQAEDAEELAQTPDRVARGGAVIDPALVHELVSARRRDDLPAVLGPWEREVLALMAEGRPKYRHRPPAVGHRGHSREARTQHPHQACASQDRR